MNETVELNYNLQSILDILGLVQGMTLGILLLVLNYRHHRASFFLGLYLFLFSLKLAYFIPSGLNIDQIYPELFLLPFNFSWLLFPMFFVYTHKVSIFSDQKIKYWVLYPGILAFGIQIVIYFQPYSTKLVIAQSLWYELLFTFIGICYAWGIGIWNLNLLNRHSIEVKNTFSSLEFKVLNWARIFLIYSLVTSVLIHILYFISPKNYYFKIFFSILDLIAIYWIAVNGARQRDVLSLLSPKKVMTKDEDNFSQQGEQPLSTNEDLQFCMEKIDKYMMSTECFVRKNLTIIDLADELNVHPKRISTTINTIFNQNFNSYINLHRIQKAESMLKSDFAENLSIDGIGKEVGFHSKSAFYSAFKKKTGTTPSKYIEIAELG